MDTTNRLLVGTALVVLAAAVVSAQTKVTESQETAVTPSAESPVTEVPHQPLDGQAPGLATGDPQLESAIQPLVDFRPSDIKFNIEALMNTLRDTRHEGWVLSAYPDPKTSRPLIGAGFSLDVPAREHPQRDPLNPNSFLEPSSAELWQAAGLDPQRLLALLNQYDRDLSAWKKKKFRRKIRTRSLLPQITEDDALKLLRISAIQAIHNAKAYCRNFEQLTSSQQMGLTQLVFQMGVNLEQFTQFLAAINGEPALAVGQSASGESPLHSATYVTTDNPPSAADPAGEYWKAVQDTLIHSDWARRYSTRAISVIAMFDPAYERAPWEAEAKVRAQVRPLHHHRRHRTKVRTASAKHRGSSLKRSDKS